MTLFKNRYRIPSSRHPTWDYRQTGYYFVTLCTHHRIPYFGKQDPQTGSLHLSDLGQTAMGCLSQIPNHFPHVQLDTHIVMPDHIHAVLAFTSHPKNPPNTNPPNPVETQHFASPIIDDHTDHGVNRHADHGVNDHADIVFSTHIDCSTHLRNSTHVHDLNRIYDSNITHDSTHVHDSNHAGIRAETQHFASLRGDRFGAQSGNLGTVIRGFKIGVTNYARQHNIPFKWQPRFHDRIIRDPQELERIRHYVQHNAAIHWKRLRA